MPILAIVAAVLLPPLGVYLGRGTIGPAFWVTAALTLVAWLPGAAFALVVLLKPDLLPPRLLR